AQGHAAFAAFGRETVATRGGVRAVVVRGGLQTAALAFLKRRASLAQAGLARLTGLAGFAGGAFGAVQLLRAPVGGEGRAGAQQGAGREQAGVAERQDSCMVHGTSFLVVGNG